MQGAGDAEAISQLHETDDGDAGYMYAPRQHSMVRMGAQAAALNAGNPLLCLPSHLLPRILSDATSHEDLLVFTSTCARVCREFWQTVRGTVAYGAGVPRGRPSSVPAHFNYQDDLGQWHDMDERSRVLREIADAMLYAREGCEEDPLVEQLPICPGELELSNCLLGEAGCQVLGAALQALPAPLALTDMYLDGCQITVTAVPAIAAAMRRGFADEGLTRLHIYNNPAIGDAGIVALSPSLPSTLVHLGLSNIGCGDAGMSAIAAALPHMTQLRETNLSHNAVTQAGWKALAEALPQLPSLRHLNVSYSPGMGAAGAAAICAALKKCSPACPGILKIAGCDHSIATTAALLRAWEKRPREQLYLSPLDNGSEPPE